MRSARCDAVARFRRLGRRLFAAVEGDSFLGVISIRHASSLKLKLPEMTPPL